MYPEHFCDGMVTADGAELPKGFEVERFCGFAIHDSDEVEGGLADVALRKLTCGGGRLVVEGIDDVRAIADGPCIGLPFDAHLGRGAYAAALLWNIETLHDRGDGGPNGANDRRTFKHVAIVSFDALMRCGDRSCIQPHGDSAFLHPSPGVFAGLASSFSHSLVPPLYYAPSHL